MQIEMGRKGGQRVGILREMALLGILMRLVRDGGIVLGVS
jgi:hypothetical protein